jgi:WD40 repeat protein
VPGPLRAATLAAAGARAAGGVTAGASALPPARKGITLLLSASYKKTGALVAVAILGVALCLSYCWTMRADQDPVSSKPPPTAPAAGAQSDPAADALPAQAAVRLGTARYRHGSRIESLAVSADGKIAVTASGPGTFDPALAGKFSPARVFDLTDGRCLYSLPNEPESYTEAVGLSPDGKTLATTNGRFLSFRDAATGKEISKIKHLPDSGGSRSPTYWLTFTPDGKQVAATLTGTAVQLINVETGEVARTFEPGARVYACVFSPDGKQMAVSGYESENKVYFARLWEVATGKALRRFTGGPDRPIGALAFSPDGATLAGGCDGRLRLFEVATGKELKAFPKIGNGIHSVAFAPDGQTVAVAGDNVHLYDPATGKERLRIERRALGLAFSRDGSVLTGAVRGAIYRWDAASGRQLNPATAQDSAVEQILVSADGRSLFTTDQDGNLHVWDTAGGKPPRRIAGGVERGVVASSDRQFLAWADGDRRIRLYDAAAGRFIDRVPLFGETAVAFLPDAKTLLTLGGEPATVRLWDAETGKARGSFPVATKLDAKRRVAPAEERGLSVRLWDVTTGKARHELNEPLPVPAVPDEAGFGKIERLGFYVPFHTTRRAALSPDGKTLAIGPDWAEAFGNRDLRPPDGRAFSPDGRLFVDWAENPFGRSRMDHVYVWHAEGRAVATLTAGPRNGASSAAFAPDGRTLATASADGVVRLWETATWTVRTEFRGHRDRVTAVAFGPDGRLFTGGLDTVVLGWDVRPLVKGAARGTLANAWEALSESDAKTGFQAQGRFLAEPGQAVEWFAARVAPAAVPDPARVKALIADLNHDNFATRARATAKLKELWPETEAALRKVAAKSSTLESRRRAEGILREMEKAITPPGTLRALRAAEVLEWVATPQARALLRELARGAPDAQLTREAAAACRRLGGGR